MSIPGCPGAGCEFWVTDPLMGQTSCPVSASTLVSTISSGSLSGAALLHATVRNRGVIARRPRCRAADQTVFISFAIVVLLRRSAALAAADTDDMSRRRAAGPG